MEISAFNTEKFERSKWRYVWFSTIFLAIIILSLIYDNIVGTVLLFFLLGGYFYYEITNSQVIKIKIENEWLFIGKKVYSRNSLSGYVLEIDVKTQQIKNIVFITKNTHIINTIQDNLDNIKNFLAVLNEHLPMFSDYKQSFIEKASRKLKL